CLKELVDKDFRDHDDDIGSINKEVSQLLVRLLSGVSKRMLSEGICYHSKRFIFLKMNIGIKKAQLTDWVKVGIALCLFFSSFSAGAGVTKYLKPQETIIVISDKPDPLEKKSALILNYWLKKIYRTDSGFVMKRESLINPK